MAPTNGTDPILVAIARLEERLTHMAERQASQDRTVRWLYGVAVLVVGLVGGPDAVQAVTGAGAA